MMPMWGTYKWGCIGVGVDAVSLLHSCASVILSVDQWALQTLSVVVLHQYTTPCI